jgi:hypothetical protein
VKISRPVWAFDRRIPEAAVTLVAGREGQGKSAFVCDLSARWTRGAVDGDRFGDPGHVIIVAGEDDRSSVTVPRLTAAGADLDLVHFVDLPDDAPFSVVIDTGALSAAADELPGRLAAVIIDPLDANLGQTVDTHRKSEVQRAIGMLAAFTQHHRCAGVGIGHLNKGEGREVLTRIMGSVGFTSAVRSVIGIGEHPDDPADRIAVLAKANMTERAAVPAVRFRVVGRVVDGGDAGPVDAAGVEWLGEEHGIDPDAIVCVPDHSERTAIDAAAEWLVSELQNGAVPYADLERMAKEEDIARATLHRARVLLPIVIDRDENARGRPSTWRLDSSRSQTHLGETKPKPPLLSTDTTDEPVSSHAPESRDKTIGEMKEPHTLARLDSRNYGVISLCDCGWKGKAHGGDPNVATDRALDDHARHRQEATA